MAETLWSVGYTAELAASELASKVFWDDVQLLAMVATMPFMLTFLWDYREHSPRRRSLILGLYMVVPVLALLFVCSDGLHGLARATARIEVAPPFGTLLYDFSGIELLLIAQVYGATLYVTVALAREAARQHQAHRSQLFLVVLGLLLPTLVDTLGMLGVRLMGQRDMAPACFGSAALMLTFAMFRRRFLELVPVARHVVFEQLPDPVLVLDRWQRVVDLNPCAQALFQSAGLVVGRTLDQVLTSEAGERLRQAPSGAVVELTHGGLTFEARSEPLESRRRVQRGRVLLLRDISTRKAIEQDLKRAHDSLEQRVEARTRELNRANAAMALEIAERERAETERAKLVEELHHAQKIDSIGRLAGGIAHDFNNLLTVILGNVELAVLAHSRGRDLHASLERVMQAGQSAADLTRQLLAFARKQPTEPRVLSLNDAVEQTHRMLLRLIGEDVRLTLRLGEQLKRVRIDPGHLEQILLNLTVNARDAMPSGGELCIATDNVELDPATLLAKGLAASPLSYVRLRVSDRGVGMSAEIQAHIFEPFFTTKGLGQGTGIGLSTVYGLVKLAHGFIEVESELGQGTKFDLYLPTTEAARIPSLPPASTDMPCGSERIVLVEDQALVRALVSEQLTGLGYSVCSYSAAEDALVALSAQGAAVQLLITDVVLAGMSGPALVDRLRKLHSELRVLYVSGYTNGEVVARGLDDTHDNLLYKPFSLLQLAQAVRAALAGWREGR